RHTPSSGDNDPASAVSGAGPGTRPVDAPEPVPGLEVRGVRDVASAPFPARPGPRGVRPGLARIHAGSHNSAPDPRASPFNSGACAVRRRAAYFLLLSAFFAAPPLRAQAPELSTFSIVACDTVAGFFGVAVQSRVVGAGSIVPAARAGVGAIATQAAANVGFKERALAMLAEGRSAEE